MPFTGTAWRRTWMTNYSLVDVTGFTLASLSLTALLLAPGAALASLGGLRRRTTEDCSWPATALLAGLSVLPLLDSLLVRELSIPAAVGANLLLGLVGIIVAVRQGWRPRLSGLDTALFAAWFLLALLEWMDFDTGRGLFRPFQILDTVKHAATVQAIFDTGAPLRDPFFLRPGHAGYYYFFYTPAALAERLCGGLADARACYAAMLFWTGVGFYNVLKLALTRAGLAAAPLSRRIQLTLFAVLCIGGLDILPVLRAALMGQGWAPDPLGWNEQIGGALGSMLWVPHHLTALIASLVGLIALSEPDDTDRWRRALFAGAAFASAFGCSVWVAFGTAATAGVWLIGEAAQRRWRPALSLAAAGAFAAVLTVPQLVDLHAGRAPGPFPVILSVRAFSPLEGLVPPGPLLQLARLACLPINYLAEFGLLFSGTALFLRQRGGLKPQTTFAGVLALSAGCGLLVATFVKSTLYNNDLGWRVVLFPLAAGVVWTVSALEMRFAAAAHATPPCPPWRATPGIIWLLGGIGLATSLYMVVNARTYAALPMTPRTRFFAMDPATQRDLRTAYTWANGHLPQTLVLQHNPQPARVFSFGLYGRNPVAVADGSAGLYGASQDAVIARGDALALIFTQRMSPATAAARARASGVDVLVVDASDPAWRWPQSWVWTSRPLYALRHVRLIPVATLGGAR